MFFAGIDLGATYIKSCRIDAASGALSRITRRPFPAFTAGNSSAERTVPFLLILNAVREALLDQVGEASAECSGILFSNQMHGLVLMDGPRAVSPFISWQDLRARERLEELRDRLPGFSFHEETGEYLRAGFPVTTLFALKRTGGGVIEGEVMDLGNAVVRALGDLPSTPMDVTNAAATGAWDIRQSRWHHDMIGILNLEGFRWPKVQREDSPVGHWTAAGSPIPLYMSVGDQQISLLGAGVLKKGQVCFNIATGSQVSRVTDRIRAGHFQTRPYFDNLFLQTITHIPAGRALNRLLKLFTELSPELELEEAWRRVGPRLDSSAEGEATGPKMDLAFFPSAFGEVGSMRELREDNLDVVSILRAALLEIAHAHLRGLERVQGAPPTRTSSVEYFGAGGILRKSAYLRQAFARELGRDLILASTGEDALQGQARRAARIAGASGSASRG